jgi:serine/threonine protein kinase
MEWKPPLKSKKHGDYSFFLPEGYKIIKPLGEGTFKAVVLAVDPDTEERVAIGKVMAPLTY